MGTNSYITMDSKPSINPTLKRTFEELQNMTAKLKSRDSSILHMFEAASKYCDVGTTDDDSSTELMSDDDFDEEDYEQESRAAKALVKAAFERRIPEDKVRKLVRMETNKKPRLLSDAGRPPFENRLPMVESAPIISLAMAKHSHDGTSFSEVRPEELLKEKLKSAGHSFETHTFDSLTSFFLTLSEESIQAYDMEIVKAVRTEDVNKLRELKAAGKTMHCGNRFGESIIHMASRRGAASVVRFLLSEAMASPRLCCDFGRNPLHDACWSGDVNFDVIDQLLDVCPDLLYITDSRGFTPLAYVTKAHWKDWKVYLEQKDVKSLLRREI